MILVHNIPSALDMLLVHSIRSVVHMLLAHNIPSVLDMLLVHNMLQERSMFQVPAVQHSRMSVVLWPQVRFRSRLQESPEQQRLATKD